MWCVDDAQICLLLLHHVVSRFRPDDEGELQGVDAALLTRLRQLTAGDISMLAAMRRPVIRIALDGKGIKSALHALEMISEAKALEAYFIRHGASRQMMSTFFSVSSKATYRRRREYGVPQPKARFVLPAMDTCDRIRRTWRAFGEPVARRAYYRLHQTYPQFSIAVLEAVVRGDAQ